jgi:hypothetical protein
MWSYSANFVVMTIKWLNKYIVCNMESERVRLIRTGLVSKKELIDTHSVYMGHNMYRTIRVGHVLATAQLDEFILDNIKMDFKEYFSGSG